MGKWIDRFKEKESYPGLNYGDKVDNVKNDPALSTMAQITSHITNINFHIGVSKINELKNLINKISAYYGRDDEKFLVDYIDVIIKEWKHDIDTALVCFRDLAEQITCK